jgi:hypothetical protein
MVDKLVEQLVEAILRLVPGKGFTELRDTIRFAKDRILDGSIDDPKQVEKLGQMAANAIGSILHHQLVAPPSKVAPVERTRAAKK